MPFEGLGASAVHRSCAIREEMAYKRIRPEASAAAAKTKNRETLWRRMKLRCTLGLTLVAVGLMAVAINAHECRSVEGPRSFDG
jgi:hypothetical protein